MDGLRVLVIDDDGGIRRLLRVLLRRDGYDVVEASTGQSGIEAAQTSRPDLMILDLGLPDRDGVEVLTHVRSWSRIPILILSVREAEEQKIAALDAGADDYLTKPFNPGELKARLRALFRRLYPLNADASVQVGDVEIDLGRRRVNVRGEHVRLSPTEYEVLKVLTHAGGRIVTTQQMLREVWGPAHGGDSHLLHVNISNLRDKLETNGPAPIIITEPGIGYRLRLE